MKSYVHNVMIKRLFDQARKKAWGQLLIQNPDALNLKAKQQDLKRQQRVSLRQTSALTLVNK